VWSWQTERWGLPYAGGWMNQPAGMLDRMSAARGAYEAVKQYQTVGAGERAQWKTHNPELADALARVERLKRMEQNG
jgi:hypothetical protein